MFNCLSPIFLSIEGSSSALRAIRTSSSVISFNFFSFSFVYSPSLKGPTLLVCPLLLLHYSIKFFLLPIPLSSLCLLRIFLHQSSLKSFSLLHLVIKLSSLLRQASWCLLSVQGKILLCLLYNPHFFSLFLPRFGAPCSEMTHFSTVVTPPHFPVPVHVYHIGVLPQNIQNRFLPHISWILCISLSSEFFNRLPPRLFKTQCLLIPFIQGVRVP